MNEIINNQDQEQETTRERVFTQEEVNKIVESRFARWKEKHKEYDELQEKAEKYDEMIRTGQTELDVTNKRIKELESQIEEHTKNEELRKMREAISKEMKVPVHLLTGYSEEECRDQAQTLRSLACSYPILRDGGEPLMIKKMSPKEQFAEALRNSGIY